MAFYQRKPDIIIRGGTIVDGTGKPAYFTDIAIIGDKIDYIGNLKGVHAPLEIDANYSTHMWDEGYYILEAINEFLNVIRKTGMRGTVSHLNVKYDNGVPNEYLQRGMHMLKQAREVEHLNVYADMLPTTFATGNTQDYMSMLYFFTRYVRDLGAISIEDAVKKVGMLPAQHFMLEGRGSLQVGNFADINVFDIHALKINATFSDVNRYCSGMDYVIVNGTPVIAGGEHTGKRPGKVLRHLPKK